jgi:nicotinate-nucleotide--dimethylbenzimidazole phosphoribosyltransferase
MLQTQLQQKIDLKTKPMGALGVLEKLALQIGTIQNSLTPRLNKPTILVFAADHGIARENVSAYPQEVTYQMVMNFLQDGAAINVFCRQNGINLQIIDAGVNYDFLPTSLLIDAKIAKGTKNILQEPAMTSIQLEQCFEKSREIITNVYQEGCNVIGFGEMGIGNTSSASLLMSVLCNLPIEKCVGRGTGLNEEQFEHKITILEKVKNKYPKLDNQTPDEVLQTFGGFEIAQMCGAMLVAYEKNMLILVDGFIATAAFLIAFLKKPLIMSNAVFCHLSDEQGHKTLLDYLQIKPLLQLSMRLGEGTGCAIAYPIIESAVNFLNNMASFESAGVTNK